MDYLKAFNDNCDSIMGLYVIPIPASEMRQKKRIQQFNNDCDYLKIKFNDKFKAQFEIIEMKALKEKHPLTLTDIDQMKNSSKDKIRIFIQTSQDAFNK